MKLIWHQRKDGLWNAACACNATICDVAFARRAQAEEWHFDHARMEREHRAANAPDTQIPACGPKLPEPNPNDPPSRVPVMRFFTNGTWRPRSAATAEVPTPVGERCLACWAPIGTEDCGVSMVHTDASGDAYRPWHLACFRAPLGIEGAEA